MSSLPANIPIMISNSDPVCAVREAESIVVGQLGQTLDGCIATPTGDSKYINSDCGLKHLHALRSAVDAVIVGVGSVNADNPGLTVRLCEGKHPVRVVIDPRGRVDMSADLFRDDQAKVIVVTAKGTNHPASKRATMVELPDQEGSIAPSAIVAVLQQMGLKRLLVEGGNCTLSRFLDANLIDRLHLIVAPVIMGCGKPGLRLSPIDKLHEAMRPSVSLHPLGSDVLFDCNLRKNSSPVS